MAGLFRRDVKDARILDAGAGAGILAAAVVETLIEKKGNLRSIEVTAFENDEFVLPHLEDTLARCETVCAEANIAFTAKTRCEDFVAGSVDLTENGLFAGDVKRFTHAILNPPYKKINAQSKTRKLLDSAGMEVSNLYAAFVWLAAKMLEPDGELVAITPRSFCNGPYFRRFRLALLNMVAMEQIHVFESRKKAFVDDDVLQENVIFHAVRNGHKPQHVVISSSEGSDFHNVNVRHMPYEHIVLPNDRDAFIHLILNDDDENTVSRMQRFRMPLDELGIEVSTGRVVDFRAREYLRLQPEIGTVPLVYPRHFEYGFIRWPVESDKKPNAILSLDQTHTLMVPKGYYVLTKRFSAKEEQRRVVAAIYDPQRIKTSEMGFENHLNYFHAGGKGLPSNLARGLALYLNSTLFDRYFRLFSGHTQVNATDLRKMRYPTREQLIRLGVYVRDRIPDQQAVDEILKKECENDG
jgi:adenine-specific DNA-methyltransferase